MSLRQSLRFADGGFKGIAQLRVRRTLHAAQQHLTNSGDKLTEIVLDAGAEDLSDQGETWEVVTDPKDFEAVTEALKTAKITPEHAHVTKIASTYTKLEGSQANAMIRLLETLEDLDDTQNVYSNFDFDEAAVAAQ